MIIFALQVANVFDTTLFSMSGAYNIYILFYSKQRTDTKT